LINFELKFLFSLISKSEVENEVSDKLDSFYIIYSYKSAKKIHSLFAHSVMKKALEENFN